MRHESTHFVDGVCQKILKDRADYDGGEARTAGAPAAAGSASSAPDLACLRLQATSMLSHVPLEPVDECACEIQPVSQVPAHHRRDISLLGRCKLGIRGICGQRNRVEKKAAHREAEGLEVDHDGGDVACREERIGGFGLSGMTPGRIGLENREDGGIEMCAQMNGRKRNQLRARFYKLSISSNAETDYHSQQISGDVQ